MPQGPGYFEMPGKGRRYSDGKGGIFFNHLGASLTQLGNLDPRKYIQRYVDENPLVTDPETGKSRVTPKSKPTVTTSNSGAGVTDAQRAELAKKNQERIAKIKTESDATVAADLEAKGEDSVFYQAPSAPTPSGRDTTAPVDPNNTGARGTSMTYDRFMADIGSATDNRKAFEVRDPFASENLPGTAGFGASFALNSGKNQQSFSESMAAGQAVDGRIVPKVTINSAEMGRMSNMLENQRQLTPGTEPTGKNSPNFGKDQVKIGLEGTGIDTSGVKAVESNSAENQMLRRRAAFLNAGDSLRGLRAAEGEMGLISQGGKRFARDTGAESGLREITQDQYRARMGGSSMTQAIKDNPIASAAKGKADARLTQSGAGSQTAATEAPSDVENPFVIGEDGKTETIDNTSALHGARNSFVKGMNTIPKILNR